MINCKDSDTIRIELDVPNGKSVTLTGLQWLQIYECYKMACYVLETCIDFNKIAGLLKQNEEKCNDICYITIVWTLVDD